MRARDPLDFDTVNSSRNSSGLPFQIRGGSSFV
jgi:hypothetical protein